MKCPLRNECKEYTDNCGYCNVPGKLKLYPECLTYKQFKKQRKK